MSLRIWNLQSAPSWRFCGRRLKASLTVVEWNSRSSGRSLSPCHVRVRHHSGWICSRLFYFWWVYIRYAYLGYEFGDHEVCSLAGFFCSFLFLTFVICHEHREGVDFYHGGSNSWWLRRQGNASTPNSVVWDAVFAAFTYLGFCLSDLR